MVANILFHVAPKRGTGHIRAKIYFSVLYAQSRGRLAGVLAAFWSHRVGGPSLKILECLDKDIVTLGAATIRKEKNGKSYSYPIRFVIDSDCVWRIEK